MAHSNREIIFKTAIKMIYQFKKQLKLVSELRQVGFKLRQHLTSDGYYFITTFILPQSWDLTTIIKYDRQVKKLTSLYL